MSGKGQTSSKPSDKGTAKAGAAKSGAKNPPSQGQKEKSGSKAGASSKASSSTSAKASSSNAKASGSQNKSNTQKPQNHQHKPQGVAKKTHKPKPQHYEASVSSSSKKQGDDYDLGMEDVCVQVMPDIKRQQALGRRPRPKTKSQQNRRNTVGLSGAFQDRLISLLKESTWSNVSSLPACTEPSLEDNVRDLTGLGFRRFEVLQALHYAKNHYEVALEWLVIHVSNDDLPQGFKSGAASAKIEVMTFNSDAHNRKRLVRKLETYGFLKSQCQKELELTSDNETQALYRLLESFLTRDAISTMKRVRQEEEMTPDHAEMLKMMRDEEFGMLQSILGDEGECQQISDRLIRVLIRVPIKLTPKETKTITLNLEVHFPEENHYPNELPLLALTCEDLKAEVIYAYTRKIVVEANQYAGQQLIYPIATWVHSTAPRVLPSLIKTFDDPENCKDAHSKYTKTIREDELEKQALKQVKKEIREANSVSSSSAPSSSLTDPTTGQSEVDTEDITKLEEGTRLLQLEIAEETEESKPISRTSTELEKSSKKSKLLLEKFKENRESNDKFKKMLKARESLPAYQQRSSVLKLLASPGSVVLISGATGCGKTTQVAQIILDDMIERGIGGDCNIICTQPRRLSAVSVAERVAAERCEEIGQSIGYSIRLEAQKSEETQVMFVTTGILLRRLQSDPWLRNVSHIIVDEVHERDLNSDFLLIILKKLLAKRSDLKLILMSATLNAESFTRYFANCPSLEIPGRTFPVKQFFLEDAIEATAYSIDVRSPYATGGRKFKIYEGYSMNTSNVMAILNRKKINYELITRLVDHIFVQFDKSQGGILIFLPGMVEISTMIDHLQSSNYARKMTILPLHSTLSTEQQQRIFKKPAQGTRKVVVSTNIAETSVTVDDVVFVIDACRVKETRYDGNIESLVEDWTSKASIRQRMGRAGRVQAGFCWSLVAKDRHIHLPEFQDPEMLRVPLDSLVLQIRVLKLGDPRKFLTLALDPPTDASISCAIKELQDLSALDNIEHLTPLGYHLGKLPVSPKIGKMLIYGAVFRCLSPILTICAALSDKAPFVSSIENRDDAEDCKLSWDKDDEYSDHLTIVKAYEAWDDVVQRGSNDNSFCKENFLNKATLLNLRDLRKQFRQILKDSGFTHDSRGSNKQEKRADRRAQGDDMNSNDVKIIKAVLCAGLYPNIAHLQPRYDPSGGITSTNITTRDGEPVYVHPSSVLAKTKKFPANFLVFHDRVKTSLVFLRDVTAVATYAALLFGGKLQVYPEESQIELDGWIPFYTSGREGILISKLRQEIDKLLLAKVVDPGLDVSNKKVTALVVSLLKSEAEMTV
jgi:HrpA-like RNA helicase